MWNDNMKAFVVRKVGEFVANNPRFELDPPIADHQIRRMTQAEIRELTHKARNELKQDLKMRGLSRRSVYIHASRSGWQRKTYGIPDSVFQVIAEVEEIYKLRGERLVVK